MQDIQDELTNEKLTQYFTNNFSLALLAIDVAKEHIQSQVSFTLDSLLDEIAQKQREAPCSERAIINDAS